MAGLSVEARTSLSQVMEAVPDDTLEAILVTVARMPGAKARALEEMIETRQRDRRRRAEAFDALIPMFKAREDGLEALTFPPSVLPRLWQQTSARSPAVLPMLDTKNDEDASRRALARMNLYAAAARVVREAPESVWPLAADLDEAGIAARARGLTELALCCDLGSLAHRATRGLSTWTGRPDEDRMLELKLLAKDAADLDPDGARRLMDILVAHISEASQILQLAVYAIGVGGHEAMIKLSEMAVVFDRVLDGLEIRARKIAAFRPGEPQEPLRLDLAWCSAVLETLTLVIQADPKGDWARRAGVSRTMIGNKMEQWLKAAPAATRKVLPRRSVQSGARIGRKMPNLETSVRDTLVDPARQLAMLVTLVRATANRFGCEALRQSALTEIKLELGDYAEHMVELLKDDDPPDLTMATAYGELVADLLERLDAASEAHTVKRRIAAFRLEGGGVKAA